MKQSRKTDNFESQLQHKLQALTQTRSSKKIKIKSQLFSNQNNVQMPRNIKNEFDIDQFSNIREKVETEADRIEVVNQEQIDKEREKENQRNLKKSAISAAIMKKSVTVDAKSSHRQRILQTQQFQIQNLVKDKQLAYFLYKNFGNSCQRLDLSVFLAKCLAEFSDQSSLPQQQIKLIYLQLQQQITTTDSSKVSLNALQLAVRKKHNSLRLYILEKQLRSSFTIYEQKLRQKQKQLEKQLSIHNKNYESKQRTLSQMQKSLSEKQKDISKRQKQIVQKQKQMSQRVKNIKKTLQQKSNKIGQHFVGELNAVYDKIDKKVNLYERNMKYRIQTLTQKANQIHRLNQYKEHELKASTSKQIQQKLDKVYNNKLKKIQAQAKQIHDKNMILNKQLLQMQQQNNKLTKILAKLQAKHAKQQNKYKQLQSKIQKLKIQLKQAQYICAQKEMENQHLVKKLVENRKNLQQRDEDSIQEEKVQKQSKLNKNKSKRKLSGRKKNNTEGVRKMERVSIRDLAEGFGQLFGVVIGRNDKNTGHKMQIPLCLCLKLLVQQGIVCNNIIEFLFSKIIRYYCSFVNENKLQENELKTNQLISSFTENYSQQCQQFLNFVSSSFAKTKQSQQHTNQVKQISRTLFQIYCLISLGTSTSKTNIQWLSNLTQFCENQSIVSIATQQCKNNKENFIYGLLIKHKIQFKTFGLNALIRYADFVMEFCIIGEPKHNQFWKYIGNAFISDFVKQAHKAIKDSKYFEASWQALEKVSIMIQRLVVYHKIMMDSKAKPLLAQLAKKSKGTLLEMNLKSIIQTFQLENQKNTNILDQLENY